MDSAQLRALAHPLRSRVHAELRALLAGRETPAERLFTRYRGRPSRALRRGRWTDGIPAAAWSGRTCRASRKSAF